MKKNILLIVHALGYGGVGKMIVALANGLAQRNDYDVTIYVEEQLGACYPTSEKVKIVQETTFFTNYYTRRFQQMFQIRKRIKELNPDLVISFQTNQNALAVFATRGKHIPVIISERGDPYQYNNIVAKLKTWMINKAEGGVFQTQKAMEYYGKGLQSRSRVIHNPCPPDIIERPKWSDRRNEISYVARFDIQQKRQDLMVEAFSKVAIKHPEIKLVFYGKGDPDIAVIEKKVRDLALTNNVEFKGAVTGILEKIKDSKLFVLSSDYEGLPNSLIEAMVAGVPCVSTDCSPGGARELITNKENGLVVPCGDADALAKAIIYMLENPSEADRMGLLAQNIRENLHPDRIFAKWYEYIDSYFN